MKTKLIQFRDLEAVSDLPKPPLPTAHYPLLGIVGATATGKSALAMELAKKFGGEIICADSRTIYLDMDIGTAKSTEAEMLQIPHHLVDIKNPNEQFTVSDFKQLALNAIEDIGNRGKLPILVGGSGLYIDAVLYDYQFPGNQNQEARSKNQGRPLAELVTELAHRDPAMAKTIDVRNRRRVERALETIGQPRSRSKWLRESTLVLGIAMNKNDIQKRVTERAKKMLSQGIIQEVRHIGETYGWDSQAMTGIIYRAFKDVASGTKTAEDGLVEFIRGDMTLVKKQLTWFKRNPDIVWLDGSNQTRLRSQAGQLVADFLKNNKRMTNRA